MKTFSRTMWKLLSARACAFSMNWKEESIMQHLGHTRSSYRNDHALLTPDTFVRAPLPGMQKATAAIHAGPAIGAGFTQYTADLETGGSLGPASTQRFVYVIDGELIVNVSGTKHPLRKDGYAYLP